MPSPNSPETSSPESSLAAKAMSLLKASNSGTLATFSIKHPEFPFASVVNYSVSDSGEPIFLLSSMATHSRNLKANPNASLLVANGGDLSASRVTLIGTVESVEEDQLDSVRESYLSANPDSAQWIDFGDFGLFRLNIIDCYIVAGFGEMGWVAAEDLSK